MFLHRLCLALGGMTVRELERRMGAGEYADWITYYAIEPFGEQRADLRAGIISSTIANANRGKGVKPLLPKDFMLYLPEQSEDITPKDAEHEAVLVESLITGLGLPVIESIHEN